jgi:outer membrane putative beta-barrel porin/alpha-amylase
MSCFQMSRAGWPGIVVSFGVALAGVTSSAQADSGSGLLADQHAPAGVMFDHMHKKGEIMLGFRYAGSFAGGDLLHGENSANDQQVIDNGCTPHFCSMKPTDMTMNMYMLDIMYAPTNWMTLMVMPMWMSHEMTMVPLKGTPSMAHDDHGMDMGHGDEHSHMGAHSHSTEGWGDTIFGPEFRLADGPGYHLQINPMFSAPTGSVDKQMDGVFTHYGMQPGSGTWDFVPSITYTGRADHLAWGAQVLGVVRLENENDSGYRLWRRVPGHGLGQLSACQLDLGIAARPVHGARVDRGPLQRPA